MNLTINTTCPVCLTDMLDGLKLRIAARHERHRNRDKRKRAGNMIAAYRQALIKQEQMRIRELEISRKKSLIIEAMSRIIEKSEKSFMR